MFFWKKICMDVNTFIKITWNKSQHISHDMGSEFCTWICKAGIAETLLSVEFKRTLARFFFSGLPPDPQFYSVLSKGQQFQYHLFRWLVELSDLALGSARQVGLSNTWSLLLSRHLCDVDVQALVSLVASWEM